jgi:hypothetical protein
MYTISILLSMALTTTVSAKEIVPKAKPYSMVQVWTTLYDQDENVLADPGGYGDPEDDMGFKIRRARAGFTGKNEILSYAVVLGMSSPYDIVIDNGNTDIGLVDANIGIKPMLGQNLWLHAGVQKIPVSREQIMSSSDLVLAERAASSVWMVPDRDAGVQMTYKAGKDGLKGQVNAGVYNGNHSILGDDNDGKLIAARAEMVYGPANAYKTYGVVEGVTLGIAGDYFSNKDIATNTTGFGGDMILRVAGASVLGEFRSTKIIPTDTDLAESDVFAETNRMGYLVQVGYTLKNYEIATRYSTFDDNTTMDNAGDISALSTGITWHAPKDIIRSGVGYEMRMETGSDSIANDTVRVWFQYVK